MIMTGNLFAHSYDEVISVENLLEAWQEFVKGKRSRADVQAFGRDLMHNLLLLHERLRKGVYRHGAYTAFTVSDPKTRQIHKAAVADRVLHHALYRKLYPLFDRTFIADSFSCRNGKGTHKALDRFRDMARQVSKNNHRTVWVLKCDIRKFFASIDQCILFHALDVCIADRRIMWLIGIILHSFSPETGIGLPLGNLTSQLFANVYMDAFDQYVKHVLRVKHYIRYADDFVFLADDRSEHERTLPWARHFLQARLGLCLHLNKVSISTLASGVDFLGWVHFPDHRVLRTITKRRMIKAVDSNMAQEARASYLGLLQHGNGYHLSRRIDL